MIERNKWLSNHNPDKNKELCERMTDNVERKALRLIYKLCQDEIDCVLSSDGKKLARMIQIYIPKESLEHINPNICPICKKPTCDIHGLVYYGCCPDCRKPKH